MSVILLLIAISLTLALLFLAGFIWAVNSGQFEDTCTPSLRVLGEDEMKPATGAQPANPGGPWRTEESQPYAKEQAHGLLSTPGAAFQVEPARQTSAEPDTTRALSHNHNIRPL